MAPLASIESTILIDGPSVEETDSLSTMDMEMKVREATTAGDVGFCDQYFQQQQQNQEEDEHDTANIFDDDTVMDDAVIVEEQQPCTRNAKKQKKSVRFAEFSEQYFVPTVQELSKEEYFATYMTRKDYKRIHADNKQTITLMNNGVFPDDDTQYFRGLEFAMTDYIIERKRIRAVTVDIIRQIQQCLAEEEEQMYYLLDIDPKYIEDVYSRHTQNSLAMAIQGGSYDANVASTISSN